MSKRTTFKDWLYEHHACSRARRWIGSRSAQQAWADCTRPHWMWWTISAGRLLPVDSPTRQRVFQVILSVPKHSYSYTPNKRAADQIREIVAPEQFADYFRVWKRKHRRA